MDTVIRLLVVGALIAYSVFRLIRYFRYGMARRVIAVPPSTVGVFPAPDTAAQSDLPVATPSRLLRARASAISVLVFVGANGALLFVLFGLPALGHLPVIWRLLPVIFINFYLLPYARAVGEKEVRRMQARTAETKTPVGG